MENEHSNNHHAVFLNTRRAALIAACIWLGLSVMVEAQTSSPTPLSSPGAPWATTDQEGLAQVRDEIIVARDEMIVFRRLVIIMAGIGLGWQTCLLLFKHH
jgi:hypothetical protein